MIKRFFGFLAVIFLARGLFADSKNLVYNESFSYEGIDSLEISLSYEDLKIFQIYGDEIVIEIGSNNIKKIPEVSLEEDQLSNVLKITTKTKSPKPGNECTVYLYIPQDFLASEMKISLVSGNLQADILRAQNALYIKNTSGRLDILNLSTEFLNAGSISGNITIQKLSAGYFDIKNTSGNIFVQLEKAIEAKSRISNVSGKIQVYYKKNESPFSDDSPDLILSSISGKIESVPFD